MKIMNPLCPTCGKPAVGTVDNIIGVAIFDRTPTETDTEVEYSGDTNVDWNSQHPITDEALPDGHKLVTCGEHNWFTEIEDWR